MTTEANKSEGKSDFPGASTSSFMPSQANPAVERAGTDPSPKSQDTATAEAEGAAAPVPVHGGNQHMVLGAPKLADDELLGGKAVIGGPGTSQVNAGLTRTVGHPESEVKPIRQVGNVLILPEDRAEDTRPEFEPGKPKPRTDIDADPHEKTTPGFQGFDRVNPLPVGGPLNTIEHRGAVNEPRVVGVLSVGDPPIRTIGEKSLEAQKLQGKSLDEVQTTDGTAPAGGTDKTSETATSETSTGATAPSRSAAAAANPPDETELKGQLPDDFPGRTALANNSINTYGQLRKAMSDETWPNNVTGVGPVTADEITEALKGK